MRGGFACCLHQGASGRCWVSEAGFLIVWSPAHGYGGSCLFLRFHTAPLCLIANAASPHRLLSSVRARPLWSMVNKYERPTAYGGITVEKTQLQSFGSVQEISTVYLWYLQTVYEVNDYRSSNKQKEEEEISQITDVSVCVCVWWLSV